MLGTMTPHHVTPGHATETPSIRDPGDDAARTDQDYCGPSGTVVEPISTLAVRTATSSSYTQKQPLTRFFCWNRSSTSPKAGPSNIEVRVGQISGS